MQQNYQKRILICPLDWGLGHAARCIPIIKQYLEQNNTEVIIAADKRPLELLKKEFPQLQFVQLPGYNISYSENTSMVFQMVLSAPKILWGIYKEHQALKKIIKDNKVDVVISDNRYGLWNKQVRSIFITHQIMIKSTQKLKFLEPLLYKINKKFIKQYSECWIPDYEGNNNLSGDLSHLYQLPTNAKYIGTLSRFSAHPPTSRIEFGREFGILVILSGPEPQRTVLEKKILAQLKEIEIKTIIVRGTPGIKEKLYVPDHITVYDHLESEEMRRAIVASKIILCRSGYSTIMDLAVLNKKAIFIPTPGQTEQEYLAEYHAEKGNAIYFKQNEFNLKWACEEFRKKFLEPNGCHCDFGQSK